MKSTVLVMTLTALVVALGVAAPTVSAQRQDHGRYAERRESRDFREARDFRDGHEHRRFDDRRREFNRGHFELVTRRVWHEGYTRCIEVPAEYVTRYDHCGRPYTVCVRPAHVEHVQVPGYFETVTERVWVNGYTTSSCGF